MKRQCLISMLVCLFLLMNSHQNMYGGEFKVITQVSEDTAESGLARTSDALLTDAEKTANAAAGGVAKKTSSVTADSTNAAASASKELRVPEANQPPLPMESPSLSEDLDDAAFHDTLEGPPTDRSTMTERPSDADEFKTDTTVSKSASKADAALDGAEKAAPKAGPSPASPVKTPKVEPKIEAPKAGEPKIEAPKAPTSSQTKEIDAMSPDAKAAYKKMSPEEQEKFFEDDSLAGQNDRAKWAKGVDEKAAAEESKKFFSTKGMTVKGTLKSGFEKIVGTAEIIGMAVLFMIPSIFESAFLAEEQRNALLLTYSAPIQFGNIVLQIPDSEINLDDPTMSDFIYYGIPVDAVGSPLSAGAAAMYPGVHGPDKNNAICKGITSGYAKAFSLGTAKISPPPARYNLDDSALSTLPIFVSYSENSWDVWGTSAITDPSFAQMLINLNTGMVFYADGLADNTPPAPLVGAADGAKSVESYLSTKLGKLSTSGSTSTFTEYSDTFSASKSSKSASPITKQFNCGCLQKGGADAVLSADVMKTCTDAGDSTCLLVPTLNSLAAGMIISSAGLPLTKDQDLTTEVTAGALGQVYPIKGLGDKLDSEFLDFFPGAEQDAMSSSNLTVEYGFLDASGSSTDAKKPTIEGAEPDNYAAKGVYVYQCKNTPFVKMLKHQSAGYNDHITDFIVFFDEQLNQVPLMVPMEDPKNYNFPTMLMNPAIKYWSTIITNDDYSYLPQLMVTPSSGTAIAPLYGLQAQGGHFQVNGNNQLMSKIGGIVQDLESHAELGEQFKAMRDAMLQMTKQGPFGKYNLQLADSSMIPVIGGVKMSVYTGYNTYPMPQDQNCSDVLIPYILDPVTNHTNTTVLPSDKITGYYGMVSDLTYAVASDGTIAPSSSKNSCFSQSPDPVTKLPVWTINPAKVDTYYWLSQLTSMNNNQPLPQALTDYVHANRQKWVAWVNNINANSSSGSTTNAELVGIKWVGSGQGKRADSVLKIIGQQALTNSLYVYTCTPNPSKLSQDFVVLTDSQNPAVSDPSLGTKSATTATLKTNMLSLVSGILYDSSGNPIKNSLGVIYQVDAMTLVNGLYGRNLKGFSDDFTTSIVNACNAYKKAESAFVYPFEFYNLKLGMYQADIDIACYVYGDAFGAGTSTDFKPRDYFVTYDNTKGVSVNQQLSNDASQCIVSLVSGIVYSKTAASATLSGDSLKSLYATVSKSLRTSLKADIDAAIAAFANQQKANSATDAQTQADAAASSVAGITWKPADVLAKITAIASQPYIAAPYVMLKQDPSSKQYVQVSPASTDGTDYMYTFFDVPYQDGKGATLHVGGMFDSKGNQLYLFGDLQLESALIQNGISIDAKGKQMLGVPSLQPIMLLDKDDLTLKAGATGKSMIHAGDANFPSLGITSPVTYQNRTSYFYYNTIMKAYYVMEVNGKDVRYISMAGGNIYNQDGSFRASLNPVALKNGTDATDIFLAYLNADSYTECMMMNNKNSGLYQLFTNVENSFQGNVKLDPYGPVASNLVIAATNPYNQVSVIQAPRLGSIPPMPTVHDATQYIVYWDVNNPTIYKIDPMYAWQNLALLPVSINDQNRSMMNPMPATTFRNAGMVLKNGKIDRMVFGNNLYAVVSCSGSVCTMKQVNNPSVVITVSLKKDPKICTKDLKTGVMDPTTGVNYCEVVAGNITYNYQIIFDVLSADQLTSYQYNSWQSETIAAANTDIILTQFLPGAGSGSLQLQSVGIAAVANIPTVTDQTTKAVTPDQTAVAAVTKGLTRVKKDAVHGRFVAAIYASGGSDDQGPFYDYFNQDGYADLENGALFDSNGVPVGIALKMSDLMALSTKLSVTVTRDDKQVASLLYKAPSRFKKTTATSTAAKSQGMVLGRLGSHQDEHSSSGMFGWMSSMISQLGSMIFGN